MEITDQVCGSIEAEDANKGKENQMLHNFMYLETKNKDCKQSVIS